MPEKPDLERIQTAIRERREDLVATVAELEQVVRDKLDVRGQVNRSVDRLRHDAQEIVDLAEWQMRAHPLRTLAVAVGAGFVLGTGVALYMRGRD